MEMSLIKKDKKDWTRFKLTLKEFSELRGLLDKFGIDKKQNNLEKGKTNESI